MIRDDLFYRLFYRPIMIAAAAVVVAFLLGYTVGHCAIPPGTPGSTMCQANLDEVSCARFQKQVLDARGYELKIIEGVAFATVAQVKQKTFTVFLKCVDPKCNVHIVTIKFIKDKLVSIDSEATGERIVGL
jgi:hypothetical protein